MSTATRISTAPADPGRPDWAREARAGRLLRGLRGRNLHVRPEGDGVRVDVVPPGFEGRVPGPSEEDLAALAELLPEVLAEFHREGEPAARAPEPAPRRRGSLVG